MFANKIPHLCVLEGWNMSFPQISALEKAWGSKSGIQKRQD